MARNGKARVNTRHSNDLISKIANLALDHSECHADGLNQDMATTRYIADVMGIKNSRYYSKAAQIRQQNGNIASKETTVRPIDECSLGKSCYSPALRSCIAFVKGDEYTESPQTRKSGRSVKILKKAGETSCPTCSGSESDLSRERLPTKGKCRKTTTDMKLLLEAVNNLENSDCVSNSSTKKRSSTKKNMTFTNEELYQIGQQNRMLLNKIVESQRSRRKPQKPPLQLRASSAINRMKKQMEINYNNQILLRKIQQAKSTLPIKRVFSGKQHY